MTPKTPTRRFFRAALALLMGTIITSACGTRVERSDNAIAFSPGPAGNVSAPTAWTPASEATPGGEAVANQGSAPGVTRAGGGEPGASTPGQGSTSLTTRVATPAAGAGTPAESSRRHAPTPENPDLPSTPGAPAAPPTKNSPIVVASVGTYSGPAGTVLDPIRRGAELWVRSTNARGGINGKPVKLLVFDDGGDGAKHRAQVQEAVERQHVIGFLANAEVITGQASVDYLNSKRVPVVGTDGGEEWPYTSAMYFLPVATGSALLRTFVPPIAQQLLPKGKKLFGSLICVEAAGCNQADEIVAESARKVGLQQVYRGRSSLAQPDFTAECLSARNQGTEILLVILDQNSIDRVANSCSRQGYRPTIALIGQVIADKQKTNPLLAGAVGSTSVFPYSQSDTPASDEFQTAMKLYGKSLPLTASLGIGWAAGKLLEKAAANISEPPTSASLLEGLWSIKSDTLGGIVPALTFTRDQPPPPTPCWFNLVLSEQGWLSPDANKLQCL